MPECAAMLCELSSREAMRNDKSAPLNELCTGGGDPPGRLGYTGAFTGSALRTRRRAPPSLSPRGNRHTAAAPFYRRSRLVLGCIAYFHTPALRCAKERQNQGM